MDAPPQTPSDEALMDRLQKGDDNALAELMVRWERPIKGFLGRMLQNRDEAGDLAQDVFVRLYQQRGRFRKGARFTPWLYTIAANLARNRLRWWRRRPVVSLDAWSESAGALPDETRQDAALRLERLERAEAVRAAVAGLPPVWRAAVVLCEFEGMAVADAAEVLGSTTKAVESRLYRARESLRRSLQSWRILH